MTTTYAGFNENILTFEANDNVTAGIPVKLDTDGKVKACADNEAFIGIAQNVRNGYAAVQLCGYVKLAISGSCAVGYQKLASTVDGKIVKNTTTGREYLVLEADTNEIGFIL